MKQSKKRIGLIWIISSLLLLSSAVAYLPSSNNINKDYRGKGLALASKLRDTTKLPPHLKYALRYIGYQEEKNNSGSFVDWLLESCNIKPGSHASWCSGFVSKMMDLADVSYPEKRTALAMGYRDKSSIKARDVAYGGVHLEKNKWYLVIWQKGTTSFGHIGFLYVDKNKTFYVIEGNGASGNSGDQSNGGMVVLRQRTIQPYAYFRIVWFTEIKYERRA